MPFFTNGKKPKKGKHLEGLCRARGMRKNQNRERGNTEIGVGCEEMNDQSLSSLNKPSENVV